MAKMRAPGEDEERENDVQAGVAGIRAADAALAEQRVRPQRGLGGNLCSQIEKNNAIRNAQKVLATARARAC